MIKNKLELGDRSIAFDLESNILDYGISALKDFNFDSFHSVKYSLINFTSFIECYSKYIIEKEDPKKIWKKEDAFSVVNHENADFISIQFIDAIKKSNLFSINEIKVLGYYYRIRNQFVHYSLNSTNRYSNVISPKIIKYDEIILMFDLLKRLLIKCFEEFDNYSTYRYIKEGISKESITKKECPYKY